MNFCSWYFLFYCLIPSSKWKEKAPKFFQQMLEGSEVTVTIRYLLKPPNFSLYFLVAQLKKDTSGSYGVLWCFCLRIIDSLRHLHRNKKKYDYCVEIIPLRCIYVLFDFFPQILLVKYMLSISSANSCIFSLLFHLEKI